MKKFAILLTAIGFAAAAPLATASEDGIDLMPKVEGVEITHFVRDDAGSSPVKSSDEFYARGTGGLSPQ
jgi:hypothetical protein